MDLQLKQQSLDLALIRKSSEPFLELMPDSFEDLAIHNLMTFKSHKEPSILSTLVPPVGCGSNVLFD